MELFSEKFRGAVRKALESRKLVMAVVHWKAQDRLITDAKSMKDAEIFTVTGENREKLPETIAEKALIFLRGL
jgi:nucleoside-triphosphatase